MDIIDLFTTKKRRIIQVKELEKMIEEKGLPEAYALMTHRQRKTIQLHITSQWFFTDIMQPDNPALPEFRNSSYFANPTEMEPMFIRFLQTHYGLTDKDSTFIQETFLEFIPKYIDILYTSHLGDLLLY
jgi:hypothetical protein